MEEEEEKEEKEEKEEEEEEGKGRETLLVIPRASRWGFRMPPVLFPSGLQQDCLRIV